MGSNASKSSTETAAVSQNNDLAKDISSNPDPRSPTPEITRTPLQNKNGAKHNITKNVDLRKTFESDTAEEKLIRNNPILTAVIRNHLQSYDPRSPTQDFERTPIVITNIDDDTGKRLQKLEYNNCGSPSLNNDTIDNNNFDSSFEVEQKSPELVVVKNLYDKFNDLALNDTIKETDEPLGSSTASNEIIENELSLACHKPTTLLETNFDFVETEENLTKENNVDIGENIDRAEKDSKHIPLYKILNDDPRSPSIGIERTPIVAKIEESIHDDNVEKMSDDLLIKALQNTNTELQQSNGSDRSPDGILIFEDESESLNDTPKKSKSASSSGSRTPLSCMKNKTDAAHRSKSTNTLYDTKNATKLQKRVSHIPRLKSLIKQPKYGHTESSVSLKNVTKSSAISGDCENTPPHSHRDRWDKDNSIVL